MEIHLRRAKLEVMEGGNNKIPVTDAIVNRRLMTKEVLPSVEP